jgi:uncharacterized membrane protein YgaE (UPF0421/DUF939 family)
MVKHRGILVEGLVLIVSVAAYPVMAIGSKLSFVWQRFFPSSSELSDSTANVLSRLAVVLTTLQNKLDVATQEERDLRENARALLRSKDRSAALHAVRRADNKRKQAAELSKQIQLIEVQRLRLESMQTTEDVVRSQQELADVMKRAKLSNLATDAEQAADTISDGTADLEDARDVLSNELPPVQEDEELLAALEEELLDEELSSLTQPDSALPQPRPFQPPPGDAARSAPADAARSASPPADDVPEQAPLLSAQ